MRRVGHARCNLLRTNGVDVGCFGLSGLFYDIFLVSHPNVSGNYGNFATFQLSCLDQHWHDDKRAFEFRTLRLHDIEKPKNGEFQSVQVS